MSGDSQSSRLEKETLKNSRESVRRCVEETGASALALSYCVKVAAEYETDESLEALLEYLAPGRLPQEALRKGYVEENVLGGLKHALRHGSCNAAGLLLDSPLFAFWASDGESQRRVGYKLDDLFGFETVTGEDIGQDRTEILGLVCGRIANPAIKWELARRCAVWDKPSELDIASEGMGPEDLAELLAHASGRRRENKLKAAQERLIVRLLQLPDGGAVARAIALGSSEGQKQAMFAFMSALEKGELSGCAGDACPSAARKPSI